MRIKTEIWESKEKLGEMVENLLGLGIFMGSLTSLFTWGTNIYIAIANISYAIIMFLGLFSRQKYKKEQYLKKAEEHGKET